MTECTATFQVGVDGNPVLVADSGSTTAWNTKSATGSGTVVYDNDHPAGGTSMGAKFTAPIGSTAAMGWQAALGTVTNHYGRLYLYATGNPTDDFYPLVTATTTTDTNLTSRIDFSTAGIIRLVDSVASTQSGAIPFALNQLVRLEWHIIHSATVGQIEAKLFNTASSTTPTETVTSPASWNTRASADRIFFGFPATGTAFTFYLDEIIAGAAAYPGPVAGSDDNITVNVAVNF